MWKPSVCCPRKPSKSKGFSGSGQIEACVFLFGWTEICLVLLRWGKKNERFGSAKPPLGKRYLIKGDGYGLWQNNRTFPG